MPFYDAMMQNMFENDWKVMTMPPLIIQLCIKVLTWELEAEIEAEPEKLQAFRGLGEVVMELGHRYNHIHMKVEIIIVEANLIAAMREELMNLMQKTLAMVTKLGQYWEQKTFAEETLLI